MVAPVETVLCDIVDELGGKALFCGIWRAPGTRLTGRYRNLLEHLTSPLLRNGYALMLSTGITGLLGVAYWLLAAHRYSAVDVGRASAAYAALSLLSGITAHNMLGALTRFFPGQGDAPRRS